MREKPTHALAAGWPTNDRGQRICGAKARRSPTGVCRSTALGPELASGVKRCRMHNGWPPCGPANHAHKTGKYAVGRLQQKYERELADPKRIELGDDVAVITAKIAEVLSGAPTGGFTAVQTALATFKAAVASKDPMSVQRAFEALEAAVADAVAEDKAWREVVELQRHKVRLCRTEHLRVLSQASMVDAASAWALIHAVVDLVRVHCTPEARRAIGDGLQRLLGRTTITH